MARSQPRKLTGNLALIVLVAYARDVNSLDWARHETKSSHIDGCGVRNDSHVRRYDGSTSSDLSSLHIGDSLH